MKKLLFLCLCVFGLQASKNELDKYKWYNLTSELCSYRGSVYKGSITLDVSDMELDTLDGISQLLVSYESTYGHIRDIKRLRIIAKNNNLLTLPKEILNLDVISVDVEGNPNFRVPDWVYKSPFFYVYYSDEESGNRMIKHQRKF